MESRVICIAATSLNQWAMEFEGNYQRIRESILEAKLQKARYRFGPELEICGYGCSDHYFEPDTEFHCWQVLAKLLADETLSDIIIDIGMPVTHRSCMYNCRLIVLNGQILGIVPKQNLANDGGNYREMRYFVAWRGSGTEDFRLPEIIRNVNGQKTVPIGLILFRTLETAFGVEICEDMWVSDNPHVQLYLQGAELVFNSSASHFSIKKYWSRRLLASGASSKYGGLYGFCNAHGCDGDRLYFEGETLFALNGQLVAMGEMFALEDIKVLTCAVDLNDIRGSRKTILSSSNAAQALQMTKSIKIVDIDFSLVPSDSMSLELATLVTPRILSPEEEISLAPAMWLWDYLRRSGMAGFFLPLSGGIDSASVACIVGFMSKHIMEKVADNNLKVIADVRKVVGDSSYIPKSREELVGKLFYTCYMGTKNSSDFTKTSATNLAKAIGSSHTNIVIDTVIDALIKVFHSATNFLPKFKVHGGTRSENLAMQNLQARIRMVFAYCFAQLMVYVTTGKERGLLVLGSGNVDEALRGYLTKYDCSSADINPIGGISKTDLRKFVRYAGEELNIPVLKEIYNAPPTAELEPLLDGQIQQTDEQDMGMTYEELSMFGRLRKVNKCGPYSMYLRLLNAWKHLSPVEVASKVKHFFTMYSINRHKQTVLTPSVHMENYSPDDNRFDLRQFLYNVRWPWQFRTIDEHVQTLDTSEN